MNAITTINVLNELIATTEDGKKGFSEASDDSKAPDLKEIFRRRAAACNDASVELQSIVKSIGGLSTDAGTLAGSAHRGWIKVKSTLADSDISALEEVEKGEGRARAVYEKALKSELPDSIREVVQCQYDGTLQNYNQLLALRASFETKK